jgi:holo-[acyl-carrier protein] synthase
MMLGLGIDAVDIHRFDSWANYDNKMLSRIFTAQEIAYAKKDPVKSAERFAARFASKEAFFKAFSTATAKTIPFLTLCKLVSVDHQANGAPTLLVDWDALSVAYQTTALSITHTSTIIFVAVVILPINH